MNEKNISTMIEVMQAFADGKPIEISYDNDAWAGTISPAWDWRRVNYRVARVKDSINWDHVHSDYKYMARDKNGGTFLFVDRPVCGDTTNMYWSNRSAGYTQNACVPVSTHVSYVCGTVPWDQSLVERP